MPRTTIVEEYFEVGDRASFSGKIYTIIGAEDHEYTVDEITHVTQRIQLDGVAEPVDAAELELLSPRGYEPF